MVGHAFMGGVHSHAWRTAHRFFDLPVTPELAVLGGRDLARTKAAAAKFGWASVQTDWRELVSSPDVQIVDICTPGDSHCEIAIAALEAGKHVLCEKPLANTVEEAEEMTAAAEAAKDAACAPWWRSTTAGCPPLAVARKMIEAGRLGEIRHVRALYLQDWLSDADAPMTWRLRKDKAGSGALGDLGAHIVDATQFLVGDLLTGVSALTKTFVHKRPNEGGGGTRRRDRRRRRGVHRPVRERRAGHVRGDPVRVGPQERHVASRSTARWAACGSASRT